MYIPKRWLVPGALSLVLLTCVLATVLAGPFEGRDTEALDIASKAPLSTTAVDYTSSDLCTPVEAQPAALTAQQEAEIIAYLEAVERNRIASDSATNSGVIADSQFNDGGFGDIGVQWREVENSAPITNVHISGVGNHTTVVVGDGSVVTVFPEEPPVTDPETLDPSLVSTPPAADPAPVVETPAVETPAPAPVEATPVSTEAPAA